MNSDATIARAGTTRTSIALDLIFTVWYLYVDDEELLHLAAGRNKVAICKVPAFQ